MRHDEFYGLLILLLIALVLGFALGFIVGTADVKFDDVIRNG